MNKLLIALSLMLSGSFAMADGAAVQTPPTQESVAKEKKEVKAEKKKVRQMKRQLHKDEKALNGAATQNSGEAK